MTAAKRSRAHQLVKDGWDLLCAAVAAARALLPALPFLLRVVLSAWWNSFRLRRARAKCALCGCKFSRAHVFRLHPQAGWVCADCHDLFNNGNRALARASLEHAGIAPPEESAA